MSEFVSKVGVHPRVNAPDEGPLMQIWRDRVTPLLKRLDLQMDCRLVSTLSQTVRAIIEHRHRNGGLLLSELGAYLCNRGSCENSSAPAGTKRLSNLLRSSHWNHQDIEAMLWQQAKEQMARWEEEGEEALCLWDESVLEKPESLKAEGLSPVRSSKAGRLSRIKPGFYQKPSRPVFVPGLRWMALLFIGHSGPPVVGAMRWWGTRQAPLRQDEVTSSAPTSSAPTSSAPTSSAPTSSAPTSSAPTSSAPTSSAPTSSAWIANRPELQRELLQLCQSEFGALLLHLFDRGFAGTPWLRCLAQQKARFVLRWPKSYKLWDKPHWTEELPEGLSPLSEEEFETLHPAKAAWEYLRGQRSWDHRLVRDAPRKQERKVGVVATTVYHPAYGDGCAPLTLVASRPGQGKEPWYLLTNEVVETAEQAWKIVQAYARRWQIEMSFRFQKSELALESPRLWSWERRLKLLWMVTLAYSVLLALLRLPREWINELLRFGCHRTGKRCRETPAPLSRLRIALACWWNNAPPPFTHYQSSG